MGMTFVNGLLFGTGFVIQEFMGDKWSMPACPEVTLGTLNKLIYIGWAPVVNS